MPTDAELKPLKDLGHLEPSRAAHFFNALETIVRNQMPTIVHVYFANLKAYVNNPTIFHKIDVAPARNAPGQHAGRYVTVLEYVRVTRGAARCSVTNRNPRLLRPLASTRASPRRTAAWRR